VIALEGVNPLYLIEGECESRLNLHRFAIPIKPIAL